MINVEALVCELLDAIDEGSLNEKTISQFSYWHLYALFNMASQMDNGRELFVKIKTYLEKININRLKKQKKIQVGFLANASSTWIGDDVYNLFEKSERFEPYVIVLSNYNSQSDEMRMNEYYNNLNFFKKKNFRIIETMTSSGECFTWEEIGIKPQIFVWLTPWPLFRGDFILQYYSLDTLHAYIPYGFMLADNSNRNFVFHQYNQEIHNLVWKIFEESKFALDLAEKYAFVGKSNAVYTGYPKMDAFYNGYNESTIWDKLLKRKGDVLPKRIIYAPHHTINENGTILFSTFAVNYNVILRLAKKYKNETVWAFKPHPFLKHKAIEAGIFDGELGWDRYIEEWNSLENAMVIEEGDYAELFLSSDGMILDSVSFLAEYLYAHKPLLFLRREEQRLNESGEDVLKVHYTADGDDEEAIESFLKDVINGKDELQDKREALFSEKLDYRNMLSKSAAENIYEYFMF